MSAAQLVRHNQEPPRVEVPLRVGKVFNHVCGRADDFPQEPAQLQIHHPGEAFSCARCGCVWVIVPESSTDETVGPTAPTHPKKDEQ